MSPSPPGLHSSPVRLSPWLQGASAPDWEPASTSHFRGGSGIQRRKHLDLASAGHHLALLVGLKPAIDPEEIDIWVQVYPTHGDVRLPYNLRLAVLDETCEAVMQAIARETKNIQLEFSGQLGERFSVRVALGDLSLTEAFVI